MSRAEEQARLAQLRELGPTPPDYDGPGSVRPATLEQCWRLIEELDREALAEGSAFGAYTRLVREVRELAVELRTEAAATARLFPRSPGSPPRVGARADSKLADRLDAMIARAT